MSEAMPIVISLVGIPDASGLTRCGSPFARAAVPAPFATAMLEERP